MLLPSQSATEALARAMRPHLRPGDVVLLEGPVGAGKSAFARALIQDAMVAGGGPVEPVPSPTFTLVQTYETGTGSFWHADLYRLAHVDELAELGLDEAFGTAVTLIEWPERLGATTPARHLRISLSPGPTDAAREIRVLPAGAGWDWIGPMLDSFSSAP